MATLPASALRKRSWRHDELVAEIRGSIWRYLTAASAETALLEAAELLRMRSADVYALGRLMFLVGPELGSFLDAVPELVRHAPSTTQSEEEWSADRVRGAIQWNKTFGLRAATGNPTAFVTSPARRAYQTPENELVAALLDAVVDVGRRSGWESSTSERIGRDVAARVATATLWRQARVVTEIERRPITPTKLSRIATSRRRHRYRSVLDAYLAYQRLVQNVRKHDLREIIERRGLAALDRPTIFELITTFRTLDALKRLGFEGLRFGLIKGVLETSGSRRNEMLQVVYQRCPPRLSSESVYRSIQHAHGLTATPLRPDLVLRWTRPNHPEQWVLLECKGGKTRSVRDSARAALVDLLAYRTAFAAQLDANPGPYGIGVVWGIGLKPAVSDGLILCSIEYLADALTLCLGADATAA